jgi:hemerythrin
MALISWSPAFSVNVPSIDVQHQKLVEMINQLHDAMRAGKGHIETLAIAERLITYTQTHFTAEEKMMRQVGYPDLAHHQTLHADLTRQVLDIQAKARAGQLGLSIQVSNFLKEWLINHIQGEDMKYKTLANQKGVQ